MITADEFGCVYLERKRTRSQDSIRALPDKPTVLRDHRTDFKFSVTRGLTRVIESSL